jgi:phosphohistidine phosphatase SixA
MRSVVWLLVLVGCGSSAAVSAARRGDDAALARAIEPGLRTGTLHDDEAARIALAVAEHIIEASKGDDAQARVRELRLCARSLGSALQDRAKTHDPAGAEAAMALVEEGEMSEGATRAWLHDASDDWRAVGARGLVRDGDGALRMSAFLDPSVKVRRSAMRASAQARDLHDVAALFEAARVDPDLMARSEAVRAIARVDPVGGDTAMRLHDLWSTSDDALREDIARAYASPHIAAGGGAEELRVLLAAGHGPGAVSAAALVIGKPSFDDDTRKSAVALLVRTIDEAPRRERFLAVAMAPLSNPDVRAALKRATEETNDLETRESALSRLLDVPTERAAATKMLFAFASPSSPERVARRARLALAADGEVSVQAWIEADLKSADPSTRLLAASALVSMHRGARAASLLADPDAHVRTSAACTLLTAATR